jgi:hypothetical protein
MVPEVVKGGDAEHDFVSFIDSISSKQFFFLKLDRRLVEC